MEVEWGLGHPAVDQAGAALHPFQADLHQGGEVVAAVLGEVGQGPLQERPDAFDGVEFGCLGGQLIVGQPWSGDGQPAHGVADVRVQVVPGEDDGTAELLLACIQQPDVVGLVEALAAVFGQPARWIRWVSREG